MAILASNYALVILAVFSTIGFALHQLRSRRLKIDLPWLQFEDGDDSRQRYVKETGALFIAGYNKYVKGGQGFQMRGFWDDKVPQVVLPFKYFKEVRNAPEKKLSLPYHSEQLFSLKDTGGITHTHEATRMVRVDLNKNLQSVTSDMHEEAIAALEAKFPSTKDWTTINLYNVLAIVVGRISARILVGPELARNDDWLALQGRVAFDLKEAAEGVRTRYPPWFRWAARYFSAPVKKVIASRRRAVELLRPLLEAREAALRDAGDNEKPRFNDGVQWLVAAYEAEGRKLTAEDLALHELFIAFGALESNLGALVGILFDLVDHPEHVRELEEEIAAVRKDSPNLPRQALNKLWKLDSFIKESQRIRPLGIARMLRSARVPFTFKDGFHIPRETPICFPFLAYNLDPDNYEEPLKFDPGRFLRKREVDPEKTHFASTSEDQIYFGGGAHACPGRFFAADEIKIIIIHILDRYELKWANEGDTRPPDLFFDAATFPAIMTDVLYRSKQG